MDAITSNVIDSKTITFTADSPISIPDKITDSSGRAIAKKLIAPTTAGSYNITTHFASDTLYYAKDSRVKVLTVT